MDSETIILDKLARAYSGRSATMLEAIGVADPAELAAWLNTAGLAAVLAALFLAFQANRIARDTAKHQLRAYLNFSEAKVEPIQRSGEGFYELQVILRNSGATPAMSVVVNGNSDDFEGDLPPDFDFPPNSKMAECHPAPVGPGALIYSRTPNLTDSTIRAARQGKRRIFIWGFADYRDIFPSSPKRRTEFCYELKVEGADGQMGMAFIPYGRHNGMDDQCLRPPGA